MVMLVDTTQRHDTQVEQVVGPSPAVVARGLGTVIGGPLLLDALEVLGPVSAAARWPSVSRRSTSWPTT